MPERLTAGSFAMPAAWIAFFMAGCVLPIAAIAQSVRIEQIPAGASPAADPAAALDGRLPMQRSTVRRGDAPAQVGPADAADAAIVQPNRERPSTASAPQLSSGKRSAQASTPLSSRRQSKPGAVVRVGGKDRCDATSPDRPTRCARVIETRSDEFTRANPLTLSAEQRLLIDTRMRDLPATAEGAVRRIGRNEVDADASSAQSIASIVLPSGTTTPATPTTDRDMRTTVPGDAEVLSVLQALVGGAPSVTSPAR